ncbi:hypothetical protein GRZ55_22520 [Chelativorans sp. ZYF759]|uniref:hypothetical protein n=1 Tax=Chelativorans sp. ZYF759 TaxID=2692213 RepID=UPI00145D01B8|nr:hypothetical protein [Chelativorans sp. ZYF759]NMG42007.1 hypothetical protein [Chelativorans sp. ZYF759]
MDIQSMDPIKLKLKRQLDRLLETVDIADREAVKGAIERFRVAVDTFLHNNPQLADDSRGDRVRQAREELITEHRQLLEANPGPPPEPERVVSPSGGFRGGFVTGVLTTLAMVLVVLVAGTFNNVLDISMGASAERKQLFESEYVHSVPHMEAMAEYAARVRDDIERRQAEDPDSLEGVTDSSFVRIGDFDEQLWNQRPESMPRGVGLIIRADRNAYKVVVTGHLCRFAFLTRPKLVDPRRRLGGINCTHFGYWNEAGEGL